MAGLERCAEFLERRDRLVARRAAERIARHFELLETMPGIGRPFPLDQSLRELLIPFGRSGYAALYRYDPEEGAVYILAFRHQHEAGY